MTTERLHDVPLGMPSPEALQLAFDTTRHRYALRETMEHPQVRSECMRLAYMIQAYGLAKQEALHLACIPASRSERCSDASPRGLGPAAAFDGHERLNGRHTCAHRTL
jgi:hypothetical protein